MDTAKTYEFYQSFPDGGVKLLNHFTTTLADIKAFLGKYNDDDCFYELYEDREQPATLYFIGKNTVSADEFWSAIGKPELSNVRVYERRRPIDITNVGQVDSTTSTEQN